MRQHSIPLTFLDDKPFVDSLLRKYGFNNLEDMYAAIGYGSVNATRFVTRFKAECQKQIVEEKGIGSEEIIPMVVKTTTKPNTSGVIVGGLENCLIRFSQCCNPVPGDNIVGYVTRGRGVAIHRADCINMLQAQANPEEMSRFVSVHWAEETDSTFQATLCVTATDRSNLLLDVMTAVSELNTRVSNVNARTGKNNLAMIELTMEVSDTHQLEHTIKKLMHVEGTLSVVRRRQ